MDEHALAALEFDAIRSQLAALTLTPLGEEGAHSLTPYSDPTAVIECQRRTALMRSTLEGRTLPIDEVGDPGALLKRASLQGVLDGPELLRIAALLRALRLTRKLLKPRLREFGEPGLPVFPDLEESLLSSLSPEGHLRDRASPKLASLRGRSRQQALRLRSLMEEVASRPHVRSVLQSPTPTQKAGRLVLAVRSDRRRQIEGVVHGRSASGETVFVEPTEAVEQGNRLRVYLQEEQAEERRILRQLSADVGRRVSQLQAALEALARLDVLAAKAALADRMAAVEPMLDQDGNLELRGARHPLLDTTRVVPIDLSADRQRRTLLLTGPNTGGKTVALKTVGLLTLMAHAGLHVPAQDRTVLPLVDGVYCDVGDEQSIEQNLSTFSSHMTNITNLMDELRRRPEQRALVLLDELGAGTDPTEGAALASAVALWLHRLNPEGLRVIITTHFSALKELALETAEMENASAEFDVQSLKPTYRILMGWPGTSKALLIAERLGLEREVVEEASQMVDTRHLRTEETLSRLEEARREFERMREAAEKAAETAQKEAERYHEKVTHWSQERERLRETYRRKARQILADARHDLTTGGDVKQIETVLRESFSAPPPPAKERLPAEELRRGRSVRVVSLGQNGLLLHPPDKKGEVTVLVGTLRVKAQANDIAAADETQSEAPHPSPKVPIAEDPGRRLMLAGEHAEEALAALDRYLDRAAVAGRDTAIIVHGIGPGELARVVREYLTQSPLVASWRPGEAQEGGPGITVVRLA